MSVAFPELSRAAFSVAANAQFGVVGFMADEQDNILLLLTHVSAQENNHHRTTQTGMSVLSIGQMEFIGQSFRARFRSDDEIFSASEEAVARQKSLGYVCYQMLRRMQRMEAEWLQRKDVDYTAKLAVKDIEEMIRFKIDGAVNKDGFLHEASYADVRVSNTLPIASSYEIGKYKDQFTLAIA